MLDPAISTFFDNRKETWLKNKTNASTSDEELVNLQRECDYIFSLEEWLPKAAKRAGSRATATHPSKFTHPSTGVGPKNEKNCTYVTPVICKSEKYSDGFMRTGSIKSKLDSLGNAGELDVDEFVNLIMLDGDKLISHIELETDLAKSLLNIKSVQFEELKEGFLSIITPACNISTSSKIKQVYFPVADDYHLLSLLTNSGMIFAMRERIDTIRFSDATKEFRELKKKNDFSEFGFAEIYNITTIGYGGDNPWNISRLNTENHGKAHLLSSLPPSIKQRNIHFPKTNFFTESHHYYESREIFYALHKIFKTGYNNINIREGRDYRLQELFDRIVDKMWAVRAVADSQYHAQSSNLKKHQLIWICNGYELERDKDDQWLDKLSKEISQWIIRSYERTLGRQAIRLGEAEWIKINEIVEKNKEALR
ncbi:MAG: type I-F CRISPR-associated protein Csy1 [Deltaproteobacteria bacterium]|nr:type I-F CRISPR-associated protein Csy1 [Deltaproteobacteria bacterium]